MVVRVSRTSLRKRVHGGPESWGGRRRALRQAWLVQTFPQLVDMSVLDLGGALATWTASDVRPKHVHIVNLDKPPRDVPKWAEVDRADACALPEHITRRRYDLVYSNSVIEHVGGHYRRVRFAETVRSLADAHWVQTPYRYFPVEPHWLFPAMQFMPVRVRTMLASSWPLAHTRHMDRGRATGIVLSTELLDRTQMRYLFPDSDLRTERYAGLPKSLIAVRGGSVPESR
jgi:hypothetical protein